MMKAKMRADVDHFADDVDGSDAADDGGDQADEDCVFVGRAEFGVNRGEEFARQQAVVGHGVEHAGLA